MERATSWVAENRRDTDRVLFCTDSKSPVDAVKNKATDTSSKRKRLNVILGHSVMLWIPAHCRIPGNERVDELAKEATGMEEAQKPTSYKCARSYIKREFKDRLPQHKRSAEVYENISYSRDREVSGTRKEMVMLARLRSGHSYLMAAYRNLMSPSDDPICPICEEDAQTVEHWMLECPGTISQRR